MSSDPANPSLPPRGVAAIMMAGAALVLTGLVAQLMANHALHDEPGRLRDALAVGSQVLLAAGGVCMIVGAWGLWRWKRTAPTR